MTASPALVQEQSLDSYIILPRRGTSNILVAQQRTDQGLDWYKTHKVLHSEGYFMPTPSQFFDFLNLLISKRRIYNGNGKSLNPNIRSALLDDILAQREPWRGEWLDAYFAEVDDKMHIFYNYRTINGELRATRVEPLERCLVQDYYIDLNGINRQGLPTRISKSRVYKQRSNIYFWPLTNGSVARFLADSDWVDLNCDGDPQYSDPALGVRRQKFFER